MFLLFDGSNLAYRSLYVTYKKNGFYSHIDAIPIFLSRMVNSCEYHYSQASVIVAWDLGLPIHRRELNPDYKPDSRPLGEIPDYLLSSVNRDQGSNYRDAYTDKDLRSEYVKLIKVMSQKIIPSLNCLSIRVENAEADDIIAWFCYNLPDIDKQIVSSDRDLLQLITDKTSVYNFMSSNTEGHLFDKRWADKQYESPEDFKFKYILEKAMLGDKSDNLPKIDSISEKTAKSYTEQIYNKYGADYSLEFEDFSFLERPARATKKGITNLSNNFDMVVNNFRITDLFLPLEDHLEYTRKIRGKFKSMINFNPDYWTAMENLESVEGLNTAKVSEYAEEIFRSNNCVNRKEILSELT